MPILLGCIADDYTGATDLANTLTRNGLRTLQLQGVPDDDAISPMEVDAVVIALKSRSIAADRAVTLSLAADAWLRGQGAGHILFKICSTFDSTDHGNIGPVTDALRAAHGMARALVTPAFPETGRTVYQGHLFVGTTLLSESPLRDHPLNPMRDANLVWLLARQSGAAVGLVRYAQVEAGASAMRSALAEMKDVGSVVVDALDERHLETIGRVALDGSLSVGASGLGLGLARALVSRHPASGALDAAIALPAEGGIAMIAGSCSQATLRQVAEAGRDYPVLRMVPEDLLRAGAIDRMAEWAAPHLARRQPFLIATSAAPEQVEQAQARHGAEAVAHGIESALAGVAERLVENGVRRLVVAGGETSGAVVERLGIRAFLIGAEVAPGVPVVHAREQGREIALVLKSGNFGGPAFFADAVRAMGA